MKDCFGKTVTSLKKVEECKTCPEFELCDQMMWQDFLPGESSETTGEPVARKRNSMVTT